MDNVYRSKVDWWLGLIIVVGVAEHPSVFELTGSSERRKLWA